MASAPNIILTAANVPLVVTNLHAGSSSTFGQLPLGTVGASATGELGVKVIVAGGSGGGASSTTVQGAAANNAVAVGNPVYVSGLAVEASTYAPAYTAGDVAALAVDKDSGGLLCDIRKLTTTDDAVKNLPLTQSSTYGTTKFRSVAVTNAATAVKAGAGNLYAWNIINLHSAAIFVKFYDTASGSTTVGTTLPVFVQQIAATSGLTIRGSDLPVNFQTAITVACVTGGADNNTTAAATLPIIELEYV